MWVRAQIDYLQRLPNDVEKRKALKQLPPDLPQTYVRIFETIDSSYPVQTATYIRRALKWLAFADEVAENNHLQTNLCDRYDEYSITCDALCQMICIGNERDWPPVEAVPTNRQIRQWCGCLIRDTGRKIELSHFTVIEFLTLNADSIPSWRVHKYLITPGDEECVTSCLRCMTHEHFRHTTLSIHSTESKVEDFLDENPVYKYLTGSLCNIFERSTCCSMREELDYLLQRFFTVKPSPFLQLWQICNATIGMSSTETWPIRDYQYPLQIASYAGLVDQVTALLNKGADPNIRDSSTKPVLLPLPLSTLNVHFDVTYARDAFICLMFPENVMFPGNDTLQCNTPNRPQERSLQVARALLESGAKVDQQFSVQLNIIRRRDQRLNREADQATVTPLVLAVLCCNCEVASLLLSKGAHWNAIAEINEGKLIDLCSIKGLLVYASQFEHIVRHIATLSGHCDLQKVLEEWIESKELDSLESQSSDIPEDDRTNSQDIFVKAYRNEDWEAVRDYLHGSVDIDINCNDDEGNTIVYYASQGPSDILLYLLEHGADPNIVLPEGYSALELAVDGGCIENIRLLLKFGARTEYRNPSGYTPLLWAVFCNRYEALQILLDAGANINAALDNGSNALVFQSSNEDEALLAFLLDAGVDPKMPDNYGTRALHHACRMGSYSKVKNLIESDNEATITVNQNSLIYGYPLYMAAVRGLYQIVELLLDNGAIINKVGRGNLLGSALMAACAYGHSDTVQLLLSRGAALEVECSRFLSAAGTARAFRKTAILEILEQHSNRGEAGNNEDQVEEARDDISENVRSDQGISDESEEEAEASGTASFNGEDADLNETQAPKKSWTDTVVLTESQETSRHDA